jgi:phosphonate transport system substrate-binding protein
LFERLDVRARRRRIAALMLALALPLCAAATARAAPPGQAVYHFGVFPYLSPRNLLDRYAPVVASFNSHLDVPVVLMTSLSFTGFARSMDAGMFDIALIQPFDYAHVVNGLGYIPLAQFARPLTAQLVVRDDSRFRELQDLRGTTLALPPAHAAVTLLALAALRKHGLPPDQVVNVRYFRNHDSCLQDMWIGDASACASTDAPIADFEKRMKAGLRIVFQTDSIPSILFVASPRVPPAQREALRQLILGWNGTAEGRRILAQLHFPGFLGVDRKQYAALSRLDIALADARRPGRDLTFGVFPYWRPSQLAAQLAPLAKALESISGKRVLFHTARSFGGFMDRVDAGEYDIIFVQPFDYRSARAHGYLPLVRTQDVEAQLFVLEGSPYRRLQDLRGQRVAMPPALSAMGKLGTAELRAAGLIPGQGVQIDYLPTHDACIRAVALGRDAGCVTVGKVLEMISRAQKVSLRPVATFGSLPGPLFLIHRGVPAHLRTRILDQMLAWNRTAQGRKLLAQTDLGPLLRVDAEAYERLGK